MKAKKYQPCEYTIRATALGISPIYFDKFVKTDIAKKLLKIDDKKFDDIRKTLQIKKSQYLSTKEFISIIDFSINTKSIKYDKTIIKSQIFVNKVA